VDACTATDRTGVADTVELLTSEVVTNSILHAGGTSIRVRVLDRGPRLRVEVTDPPILRHAGEDAENGRPCQQRVLLSHAHPLEAEAADRDGQV
jgi:anti-sigma regulatory factor (Ser/Thr protein kinase)